MKKSFIAQFDGNGSSFSWSTGRRVRWLVASLTASCLLGSSSSFGQTFASAIYTNTTGSIHGGVATGPNGVIYFAGLSSGPGTYANVVALSGTTVRWNKQPTVAGTAGDIYPVPSVDAAGQHVFVGSDNGRM